MKKLYTVSVSFQYVIVAEEDSKDYVALDTAQEAFSDLSCRDIDYHVEPYANDICGWNDQCIPYGSDADDKTIGEWRNDS